MPAAVRRVRRTGGPFLSDTADFSHSTARHAHTCESDRRVCGRGLCVAWRQLERSLCKTRKQRFQLTNANMTSARAAIKSAKKFVAKGPMHAQEFFVQGNMGGVGAGAEGGNHGPPHPSRGLCAVTLSNREPVPCGS